jgi:hypothetical protein
MRFLALLAAAAVLCAGQAVAAGYGDFSGRWRNNDPGTRDITRLRVTFDGTGNLDVRAWGQCHPTDCDWGRVDAVAYSPSPALNPATSATEIIAVFNPGFARKTLILTARPGNRLYYSLYTRFTDGSGRRPYVRRGLLRRHGGYWADWPPGGGPGGGGWPPGGPGGGPGGPGYDDDEDDSDGPGGPGGGPGGPGGGPGGPGGGLSFAEDCINFNWNNVEARFVGGEWKVVEGTHWMLSFGGRAAEAARAANIIRHYRFTQHCFIGRPNPSMHYWKRGSGVPSGGIPGDDCTRNDPDNTEARRVSGSWKLVDDSHWVLDFGPRGGEARQAEQVVKHYRLNRQCFVGRPNPSMVYWLSE